MTVFFAVVHIGCAVIFKVLARAFNAVMKASQLRFAKI